MFVQGVVGVVLEGIGVVVVRGLGRFSPGGHGHVQFGQTTWIIVVEF